VPLSLIQDHRHLGDVVRQGSLHLPRGVGHILRQMGPPGRADRLEAWDCFCLAISEMAEPSSDRAQQGSAVGVC
jgi:hypothetical protein